MKSIAFLGKPFIKLNGIEIPITAEAIKSFSRRKLETLRVIPFEKEKIGKLNCWDAITCYSNTYELRKNFFLNTQQKLGFLLFVEQTEFMRILNYF